MENFKKDIKVLKPWFILITYFILLIFIVINFNKISSEFLKYMNLLKPFFMGIAIAFVLNIPMKNIEKTIKKYINEKSIINKNSRSISILLTIILTIIIFFIIGYIIFPQLIITIINLFNNLASILNGIISNTDQILSFFKLEGLNIKDIDTETINQFFSSLGLNWNNIIKNISNLVGNTGVSVFSQISSFAVSFANFFLAFMLSLYLLSDKEKFLRQIKKLLASIFNIKTTDIILKYSRLSLEIFNNFVSGQLVEALIIGTLIYIALLIFNMPYSLLIGSITAIMALVPILGATFSLIIGFFLVLSVDPIKAFWFLIIYQVVQQFENNVIYPKVVGQSVGLPGIWTLLSIIVFGGMYGVIGMLLAVPTTAVIYSIGSEFVNKSIKKKNLIVTSSEIKEKGQSDL